MTALSLGRVLIVDDEVELMTALCESLMDQDYEALGRTSAHEALALLQEEDIDLLVCDLMMPEMDGIALLRAALDIDPHLVGIIMTGEGTIQTAVDAMKVGAFDYLLKPFRLQALLPILARALQVRRLHTENVQLREAVAIYELGQAIAYSSDTNTILHKVVEGALQQVNGNEAAIMLPTPDGKELFVAVVRGKNQDTLLGTRVSMAHSVIGWVAHHREPLTVPGAVSDLTFAPQYTRTEFTTLALPMLTGGKLMGILSVSAARRRRPFTLGQVKALSILANLAATAMENATLHTQVRQSEAQYRFLVEGSLQGITIARQDGTRVFANTALARMLGYEAPQELVGGSLWDHVVPEDVPRLRTSFEARLRARRSPERYEDQVTKKDGTLIWVERLVSLITWDGAPAALETSIDITERKRL